MYEEDLGSWNRTRNPAYAKRLASLVAEVDSDSFEKGGAMDQHKVYHQNVGMFTPNDLLPDDALESRYEEYRDARPFMVGVGAGLGALPGLGAMGGAGVKIPTSLVGALLAGSTVAGISAMRLRAMKRELDRRRKRKGGKLEKKAAAFLSQNRPEAVKKIYRALKRDHPEMSAEMKARIAARQGKPGRQHQGPPYKGPLSSEKEKRAFLQGQPQAVMIAQQRMTEVWAQLEAMVLLYQDGHWKASGLAQNGDHELFSRLYSRCQKGLDEIAEKIHGYFGNQGFSLPAALSISQQVLQQLFASGEDHIHMGLTAEDQFQALLKQTHAELGKLGVMPLGLDDWLMSTASDFEIHSYLLQQRSAEMAQPVKVAAEIGPVNRYLNHFRGIRAIGKKPPLPMK